MSIKGRSLKKGETLVQVRLPIEIKERLYAMAALDQRTGANLVRKVLTEYVINNSEDLDLKDFLLD